MTARTLCAHDGRRRARLRPVRRHAQPDVPRVPERDARPPTPRSPAPAARSSPTTGRPSSTYFFSTSGGYTENVENVFAGARREPWLQGVDDPYDNSSPYHRWGPYTYSTRAFGAKLGSSSAGRLRGLEIAAARRLAAGRAARCRARAGNRRVTGPQLRAAARAARHLVLPAAGLEHAQRRAVRARTVSGARPLVAISGSVSAGTDTLRDAPAAGGRASGQKVDERARSQAGT